MPQMYSINAGGPESINVLLNNLAKTVKAGDVSGLQVVGFSNSQMGDLHAGLNNFLSFMTPGAGIEIFSQTRIPESELNALSRQIHHSVRNIVTPSSGFGLPGTFGGSTSDMQNTSPVQSQIEADAQRQRAERMRIMQDTQTKIFEITQDVTVNKAKTADKAFQAMDGYIRQ